MPHASPPTPHFATTALEEVLSDRQGVSFETLGLPILPHNVSAWPPLQILIVKKIDIVFKIAFEIEGAKL